MYLSHLRLRNIRSFNLLDLPFTSDTGKQRLWTLVLGDNATGKTTVLRSIAIGLNDESSAAGLVREVKGSLVQQGKNRGSIYCELIDGRRKWTIVTTIQRMSRTGDRVRQDVFDRSLDSVLSSGRRGLRPSRKFPWYRLFVVGYGSGRNPEGRDEFDEYRTVDAVYTLFRYDQPLQSPELAWRRALARAKKAGNQKQVERRIKQLLEKVLMLEAKADDISLSDKHISVTKHGRSTPLADSSDGYKATATWILDLIAWHLLFSPRARADSLGGIVLLDEIEQHLHPRWQRYVITRLKGAFTKVQFVATSHSALCAAGTADFTDEECGLFRTVFDPKKRTVCRKRSRCHEVSKRIKFSPPTRSVCPKREIQNLARRLANSENCLGKVEERSLSVVV
jgi:AAA domain, putative AbiEii toxin, Type IV TA system